jgi:hypothetical protein
MFSLGDLVLTKLVFRRCSEIISSPRSGLRATSVVNSAVDCLPASMLIVLLIGRSSLCTCLRNRHHLTLLGRRLSVQYADVPRFYRRAAKQFVRYLQICSTNFEKSSDWLLIRSLA